MLSYAEPKDGYVERTIKAAEEGLRTDFTRAVRAEIDVQVDMLRKQRDDNAEDSPFVRSLEELRSLLELRKANTAEAAAAMRNGAANEVRAHASKRPHVVLPLSLRALAACHPRIARALPLRWPLRYASALAKAVLMRPRVTAHELAQAFVEVAAPGLTRTQQGCWKKGCTAAQPKAQRDRVVNDGISLANIQRVIKVLLQHSNGTGWTVRPESLFLRGDVDDEARKTAWEFDAPSVVFAANVIARIKGPLGKARLMLARSEAAANPRCAADKGLWDVGHASPFEDEVASIQAERIWEAEKEKMAPVTPRHWYPPRRHTMPEPMPPKLVCPVEWRSTQTRLSLGSSSSGKSAWTFLENSLRPSPASVGSKRRATDSTTGTPAADGKQRKVVDNRDAFRKLFKLSDSAARSEAAQ